MAPALTESPVVSPSTGNKKDISIHDFFGRARTRIIGQQVVPEATKSLPTFYRNLEEALDIRRASQSLYYIMQNHWQTSSAVNFCSNDILSLSASGALRKEFLAELAKHPDFMTGSGGSRLMDGNYPYIEQTEREIAAFHGAEECLLVGSGYEGNVAIFTAIPRPGDVIVYDALVHASTHEGIAQSLAAERIEFQHNDVQSFRDILISILESNIQVKQGRRSILVAVESVYSMDGDVCPLQELVDVSKELFGEHHENVQFVVDEAHSTGILGPQGAGLVSHLGLQKEIAVRMHTFGKAMGCSGAVIMGNKTVKTVLVNFPRSFIFTTSPAFPFVASIRAGYNLLSTGRGDAAQERVQDLATLFFDTITSHENWAKANKAGLLFVPQSKNWDDREFLTHIVTIHTRDQYMWWLYLHLLLSGYCVFPVEHPVVPVGQSRLKATFHAGNSEDDIKGLIDSIYNWIDEIVEIEDGKTDKKVTKAAGQFYSMMRQEGLSGFGMI
ncbi:unnamed protein product [Clonostachys solani]|uniref:Aminotransferase class I/classII large domain-containing protein n=1 Tax=Clonostachys solani TaxID=160281 RepID=A0A9N9Z6T9_9HYPO|nr:unnamed protein product [Clonostachys solani]